MVSIHERVDCFLFQHDMMLPLTRTLQPHDVKLLSEKAIVVLTLRAAGYAPWQISKKTGIPENQIEQGLRDAKKIYHLSDQILKAMARFTDNLADIEAEIFRYVGKVPAGKAVAV